MDTLCHITSVTDQMGSKSQLGRIDHIFREKSFLEMDQSDHLKQLKCVTFEFQENGSKNRSPNVLKPIIIFRVLGQILSSHLPEFTCILHVKPNPKYFIPRGKDGYHSETVLEEIGKNESR